MGNMTPAPGEIHRMVLELRGPKKRGVYQRYRADIIKCAKRYGARVTTKEYVYATHHVRKLKKQRKGK